MEVMKDLPFSLDHIGVAVQSLEEGFKFYKSLGYNEMEIEEVPTEKVRVGFLPMANGSNIELLEATSQDSPIAKYLAKRGPGIHHICLRVKNIKDVMSRLKSNGVQLIDDEPKKGAHNCLVAFIHPKSAGGVLIELSEKRSEHP